MQDSQQSDGTSDGVVEDEELTLGRAFLPPTINVFGHRIRSELFWKIVAGVAGLAFAITAVVSYLDKPSRTAKAAATVATTAPTPFDRVLAIAHGPALIGHVRQSSPPGSCAPLAVGASPEQAVLAVVRTMLSGAKLADSARTLDQFTGLCSLQLRASAAHGVTVAVEISSPPPHPAPATFDAIEVGVQTDNASVTTKYALQTRHNGWIVLIGAVGPNSALPQTRDLSNAAAAPGMIW